MEDIGAAVPGLAELARARGWQRVDGNPLEGSLPDAVGDVLRTMYGYPTWMDTLAHERVRIGDTVFRNSYRLDVDGRGVVVTNAWKNIQAEFNGAPDDPKGAAVCAVELPGTLPIVCVQPRRFKQILRVRESPTGDPTFDEAYQVFGQVPLEQTPVLTPEVRQRISARDDWVFRASRYFLACVSVGPFGSGDEVAERVADVLGIVGAIPTSTMPDHIDHTADDLVARAARITSLDEALAFLQGLTADERARLAHSDSPLAAMADVRTPAEAMERFKSLDEQQKMQLMALVMRVKDEGHRH